MNVGDAAIHKLFDTLERLPWPNPLMGKLETDEQKLVEAVDRWIVLLPPEGVEEYLRQPAADAEELAARAQLALAAAAWAYWKRDPYLVAHAQGIEARSDETAQQAQPEGQEPGPKDAPEPHSQPKETP
ncbi:MAG TPA: hypothetical protein VF389_11575 [Woeseiaceae bacterium]